MNVIILYLHLLAISVVSIIFANLFEDNKIPMTFFGVSAVSAMLATYGYGVWSIVQMLIK